VETLSWFPGPLIFASAFTVPMTRGIGLIGLLASYSSVQAQQQIRDHWDALLDLFGNCLIQPVRPCRIAFFCAAIAAGYRCWPISGFMRRRHFMVYSIAC
jgi:hypothetical protein